VKKATEIGDRPQHDRRDCATCRIPPGHVRHDEVWRRNVLDTQERRRVEVPCR
jgi:hypothetical protein